MGIQKVATAAKALNRVFVGNLPWTISNRELKQYFSQFGLVSQVNVVFDKKNGYSKGYGFVQFAKKESIQLLSETPNHKLEGNVLTIQPATF